MTFEEAMKALREGKKVKYNNFDPPLKLNIENITYNTGYEIRNVPILRLVDDNGIEHQLHGKDIFNDTWEIVEEKPKFTKEQIEYLKSLPKIYFQPENIFSADYYIKWEHYIRWINALCE